MAICGRNFVHKFLFASFIPHIAAPVFRFKFLHQVQFQPNSPSLSSPRPKTMAYSQNFSALHSTISTQIKFTMVILQQEHNQSLEIFRQSQSKSDSPDVKTEKCYSVSTFLLDEVIDRITASQHLDRPRLTRT
jgi:hypothetical protein